MNMGEIMLKKFSALYLFISVFALSVLFTGVIIKKNETIENNNNTVVTASDKKQHGEYRVSVWDGKIAVFSGNSKIPYKVYNTYVSSLPETDIRKLSEGIYADTSSELLKIIEEYTS